MKFEFNAPRSSGIRVIPLIPDFDLCQIEGQNGIGKTLAARLLEFLTGATPFAALPHAWESLTDLLGPLEVTVSGLPNNGRLVMTVDSAYWRGRGHAECAEDPGGRATLNGEPIDWARVRQILRVRRIAGDEGLTETLGRTLRELAVDAEAGSDYVGRATQLWSRDLADLIQLTDVATPELLSDLRQEAHLADVEVAFLRSRMQVALEAETTTAEVARLYQSLADRLRLLPRALSEYDQRHKVFTAQKEAVRTLEERLSHRARVAAADRTRQQELDGWMRRLELRRRAVVRAEYDLQQTVRALGLTELPIEAQVSNLRRDAEEALGDAKRRLQTLDRAGTIRSVTQELERPLGRLPEHLLHETYVASSSRLTGSELKSGLERRRRELEGMPEPEDKAEAIREIGRLERRLRLLASIGELKRVRERKNGNLEEARIEIDALSVASSRASIGGSDRDDLESARDSLNSATFQAAEALIVAKGVLGESEAPNTQTAPSGEDEDALEEGLPETLVDPEVLREIAAKSIDGLRDQIIDIDSEMSSRTLNGLDAVEEALSRARVAMEAAKTGREQASDEMTDASARQRTIYERLNAVRMALSSAITQLTDGTGRWSGWHPGIEAACAMLGTSIDVLARRAASPAGTDRDGEDLISAVLTVIARTALSMGESAARVRDTWSGVAGYLNVASGKLAPRLAETSGVGSGANLREQTRIQSWAEGVLGDLLSAPELRRELFEDADSVTVDLENQAVQWRTRSGQRMRRPFEAFSSGEQVFAYTRAKLEQLAPERVAGGMVVIILDEFGAFVARDRFSQLMQYVRHEALGRTADQIIVMLPYSGPGTDGLLVAREAEATPHASTLESIAASSGYIAFEAGAR